MSLRHLRRMRSMNKEMETPDESDTEAYEPLYAQKCVNAFAGITLSDSGTAKEESSDGNDSDKQEKNPKPQKKKKARKNKKARRRACKPAEEDELPDLDALQPSSSALAPSTAAEQSKAETKSKDTASKDDIRSVDVRKLNVRNELIKLFGPDSDDERPRNRKRVPNLRRIHKQVIIAGDAMQVTASGLSMDLVNTIEGNNYFLFKHSKRYTEQHISYLDSTDHRDIPSFYTVKYKHVEAQLELAHFLFLRGGYNHATRYLERAIYKMELAFHPMFRLADLKTRLEYRFIENRTFHVAMLQYIHLLSNRACHRTALELAKALMNLDPSDPLAVIFIVDVIAIRAREFEWLIKAIDYWKKERSADEMFNIKYSNAYAHYQLAKDQDSKKKATRLLKEAILTFPRVALKIMELVGAPEASQLAHRELFDALPTTLEINPRMRDLFSLYAQFVQGKWRLPENKQWLVTTATDLADRCDNDVDMQAMTVLAIRRAAVVLRLVPVEVERHLCVIKPLASLLLDDEFPEVRLTRFSDPLPNEMTTIDRYGYREHNSVYSASRIRHP